MVFPWYCIYWPLLRLNISSDWIWWIKLIHLFIITPVWWLMCDVFIMIFEGLLVWNVVWHVMFYCLLFCSFFVLFYMDWLHLCLNRPKCQMSSICDYAVFIKLHGGRARKLSIVKLNLMKQFCAINQRTSTSKDNVNMVDVFILHTCIPTDCTS